MQSINLFLSTNQHFFRYLKRYRIRKPALRTEAVILFERYEQKDKSGWPARRERPNQKKTLPKNERVYNLYFDFLLNRSSETCPILRVEHSLHCCQLYF
jgi:hypothetical protein